VTGTHLITVDQPISSDEGDLRKALYCSYLLLPSKDDFSPFDDAHYEHQNRPGTLVRVIADPIELNVDRKRVRVNVTNRGDRTVQVRFLFVAFHSSR
jgi:urease